MLPFQYKPWARTVASFVIAVTVFGAALLVFYFRSIRSLHISEIVGIFLLMLTVIPPNVAVLLRKPESESRLETGLHAPRSGGR